MKLPFSKFFWTALFTLSFSPLSFAGGSVPPDLLVSSIENENGYLEINLQNASTTSAAEYYPNGYVYIYIDDMLNPEWTYNWSTLADKGFLNANGTSGIQPQTLAGKHRIKACVDAGKIVYESDEKNNCMTQVIEFTNEDLPDLRLRDMSFGRGGLLNVEFENFSSVAIEEGTEVKLSFTATGDANKGFIPSGSTIYTDKVQGLHLPYGTGIVGFGTLTKAQMVTVCVDETNNVRESNEANNCVTRSVTALYRSMLQASPYKDLRGTALEKPATEMYRLGLIGEMNGKFNSKEIVGALKAAQVLDEIKNGPAPESEDLDGDNTPLSVGQFADMIAEKFEMTAEEVTEITGLNTEGRENDELTRKEGAWTVYKLLKNRYMLYM